MNDYFVEQHNEQISPSKRHLASDSDSPVQKKPCIEDKANTDPEPTRIRLLSWNIDGLDTNYTELRAEAVCKMILKFVTFN